MLELLRDSPGVYADVRKVTEVLEKDELKTWLGEHYTPPDNKLFALRHHVKGHSVKLRAAGALLEKGVLTLPEVSVQGKTYHRPAQLELTESIMTLLGLYLAEGPRGKPFRPSFGARSRGANGLGARAQQRSHSAFSPPGR